MNAIIHLFRLLVVGLPLPVHTSGLPGADPSVVRPLGGGYERGVQQRAASEVLASGRRRL